MTTTVTGQQIVAWAKDRVGRSENPPGSNTGPFVQRCQSATFLAGTGWPWCAAFVCRDAAESKVPLAYNGAGAHDLADHHKPWVDAAHVEPGMVADYNIGTGHTGIVVSVDLHAGTVTSIDGNWADSVVEHTLPLSEVRAFWKIPGVTYTSGRVKHQPRPKRLPRWVATTSASGHKKVVFQARKKRQVVTWMLSRAFPHGVTIKRHANK